MENKIAESVTWLHSLGSESAVQTETYLCEKDARLLTRWMPPHFAVLAGLHTYINMIAKRGHNEPFRCNRLALADPNTVNS